jgi:hypothetical protein
MTIATEYGLHAPIWPAFVDVRSMAALAARRVDAGKVLTMQGAAGGEHGFDQEVGS